MRIDSRAYLSKIRNTRRGLETRTLIIRVLKRRGTTTITHIITRIPKSRQSIGRHLAYLKDEAIVKRTRDGKAYNWFLTGAGQQSLNTD